MERKKYPVLVTIKCLVYNHEPYLRKCLDGFVMQQTTFPFEAIVHDDASTDNSAEIIREYAEKYPDIIKPILETENQYSKEDGSLSRIMREAARGKYIALCEGDDYWTDPHKLQMQVSFLESNPDYTMCCHGAKNENEDGLIWFTTNNGHNNPSVCEIIEGGGGMIPTMSIVYRNSLSGGLKDFNEGISIGDYPLNIYCALKGKVMFMDDVMGIHTLGAKDSWHVRIANDKGKYESFLKEKARWLDKVNDITNEQYQNSINFEKISDLIRICSQAGDYSRLRNHAGLFYYLSKRSFKDRIVLLMRIYYFNWLVEALLKK